MNKIIFLLLFSIFISSCENDDTNVLQANLMQLRVENNLAYANNFDKIKIIAEFPNDFNTEDDQKVKFTVGKDEEEIITSTITLINENGTLKKIAEAFIKHNVQTTLNVKATISINNVEISKDVDVSFKNAFPDDITISSSSLEVVPNSFETITLTTKLNREYGSVSLNTSVLTEAFDVNNNPIGIFVDYKDKTNEEGIVVNKFTLGNDSYLGPIKIKSTTIDENNVDKTFELTIYSN